MKQPRKGSLLDTNILIRFLLDDDPKQSPRAQALMKRLEEGRERAELEDCVLAESVWVLEKGYGVPRGEIARKLSGVVLIPGIHYRSKRVALDALSLFSGTDCDIVDCLLAARAKSRRTGVSSFDQDFRKLGCSWSEPPEV